MSNPVTRPRGLRILVVDDHPGSALALALLLKREGHDVGSAASVEDAFEAATSGREVDLLISDIGLPDGDGYELLRRVRDAYGRDVPAIAVTGSGEPKDAEDCRRAGYSRFFLKPITLPDLLAAVGAINAQLCDASAIG